MANLSHLSIYLKDLKIARRSLKQRRFREGREQFNLFMDGLDRFPEGELPISYTKYLDDFIHQKKKGTKAPSLKFHLAPFIVRK